VGGWWRGEGDDKKSKGSCLARFYRGLGGSIEGYIKGVISWAGWRFLALKSPVGVLGWGRVGGGK